MKYGNIANECRQLALVKNQELSDAYRTDARKLLPEIIRNAKLYAKEGYRYFNAYTIPTNDLVKYNTNMKNLGYKDLKGVSQALYDILRTETNFQVELVQHTWMSFVIQLSW